MEAFVLLACLPLLLFSLLGCTLFWPLTNHDRISRRVAGWLFFIPSLLLTLAAFYVIISILTHKEKLELTDPPDHPAVASPPSKLY